MAKNLEFVQIYVFFLGLLGTCFMIYKTITSYFKEKEKKRLAKEKKDLQQKELQGKLSKPKNGDKELLSFISETYHIFSSIHAFVVRWWAYVDSLEDIYHGVDTEVENFYRYIKNLANKGIKVEYWDTLKWEDFTTEDWKEAWESRCYFTDYSSFKSGIEEIVGYVEKYTDSQKEYIDNISDQDVIAVYQRLMKLVENGKLFLSKVNPTDNIDNLVKSFDFVPNDLISN